MSEVPAKSEITGRVFQVVAEVGQTLAADEPIVIVESMKMEIPVCAPCAGVLRRVCVAADEQIEEGQIVAYLDRG